VIDALNVALVVGGSITIPVLRSGYANYTNSTDHNRACRNLHAGVQHTIKLFAHSNAGSFHGDSAHRKQPVGALVQ
jgi:hypothetical protein